MPRGASRYQSISIPKLEDLGKGIKIPIVPKSYRQKLWRTIKVRTTLKLPEETEHFMNILCLHFGLSRNELVLHAINLLWSEVVDTVDGERIRAYEDKLEAVRLWRLESRDAKDTEQKKRLEKAIVDWHSQGSGGNTKTIAAGSSWRYNAEKRVRNYKKRPVVIYEDEEDVGRG